MTAAKLLWPLIYRWTLGDPAVDRVIDAIYAAALQGKSWQTALDHLNAMMPSVAFCIYGHDYVVNKSLGELWTGFDPAAMAQYDSHYASVSPWATGFSRSSVGKLLTSDAFLPRDELVRSEYYNDWLLPQENQIVGWGALVANDAGRFLAFSSTLRAQDEARLNDPLKRLVTQLMPHLDRAFKLARLVADAPAATGINELINQIGDAAIMLDAAGHLRHANDKARALFEADGPLQLKYGVLNFTDPLAQTAFVAQLHALVHRTTPPPATEIRTRGGADRSLNCLLTPLVQAETQTPPLSSFLAPSPVALLVARPAKASLLARFNLTPAEYQVAKLLADGRTIGDIALLRGTSLNTTRNQARALFDKMQVHRQSELILKIKNYES